MVRDLAPIYSISQGSEEEGFRCISSAVQINPDTTLALWQVTQDLAVLALLQTTVFQSRRGLMEYNLVFLRDGIREILNVERDRRRGILSGDPSDGTPQEENIEDDA